MIAAIVIIVIIIRISVVIGITVIIIIIIIVIIIRVGVIDIIVIITIIIIIIVIIAVIVVIVIVVVVVVVVVVVIRAVGVDVIGIWGRVIAFDIDVIGIYVITFYYRGIFRTIESVTTKERTHAIIIGNGNNGITGSNIIHIIPIGRLLSRANTESVSSGRAS